MIVSTIMLALILLVGFPLYGMRRGSSITLFTGVCAVLFSILAAMLAPPLAEAIPLSMHTKAHASADAVRGWWQLWVTVGLFLLALPLGAYLSRLMPFTFDPFDWLLGTMLALVIGMFMLRVLLVGMLGAAAGTPQRAALKRDVIVRQVVYYELVHDFEAMITNQRVIEAPKD